MAGTDNHRNSGSRRNFGVESLASIETCPDTFMSIGNTAIELHVFKKKKKKNMDKMGKTFLGIIFTFGALLLRFLVYCLVFTYKVP